MKIFVIGGTGKVGHLLVERLVKRGHMAAVLHRISEQASALEALRARPVLGNLIDISPEDLAERMKGSDVVVFAAGASGGGREMTTTIDGRGVEIAVQAAKLAVIARFILVSAFPEAGRARPRSDAFVHYMLPKKLADVHVAASDRNWVLLRSGTLTDEPGTGHVSASLALSYGAVPRADVAAALVAIAENPAIERTIIELTGGDTPVDAAIGSFIRS